MRTFAILLLMFCSVPCLASDGDWIGDVKPIVQPDEAIETKPDPAPNASLSDQIEQLRKLAEQMREDAKTIKDLADLVRESAPPVPQMPMPEFRDCDCDEHLQRIEALEGRMDAAEKQLAALVTVRQSDGTETTSAVEIDTVEGYGDFEVPVGGKVVAIDGVRVRNHFSVPTAPVANTQTYLAAPVEQRTLRIAPIQRAASVFAGRYYIDADGCTVDRVTGRKVSCPAR